MEQSKPSLGLTVSINIVPDEKVNPVPPKGFFKIYAPDREIYPPPYSEDDPPDDAICIEPVPESQEDLLKYVRVIVRPEDEGKTWWPGDFLTEFPKYTVSNSSQLADFTNALKSKECADWLDSYIKKCREQRSRCFSALERIHPSVKTFGWYHPYRRGANSDFDEYSEKILHLKERRASAIRYFYELLAGEIKEGDFAIAVVPPHSPNQRIGALHLIAKMLCAAKNGYIDATSCLIRTREIGKLSHGGDRSEEVHEESMSVVNRQIIAGKYIVLLDDVITTGSSMNVARRKLLDSGAIKVQSVAFAVTG